MSKRIIAEHINSLLESGAQIDQVRELLVALALTGKLTTHCAGNVASELLSEILQEKAALVTAGKLKKDKTDNAEVETPVQLPDNWLWVSFADVFLATESGWSPKCENRNKTNDEWGVLKVSAVSWGRFKPEEHKTLPPGLDARPQHIVRSGDFIMSRANTAALVGRSVVVDHDYPRLMMSDKHVRVRLSEHLNSRYVNYVNNSRMTRDYYAGVASGTSDSMRNLSRKQIGALPFPLAPRPEQDEIVRLLEAALALCDELEAKQTQKRQARTCLNEACLDRLLTAQTPDGFAEHWQRIHDNFDLLYESPQEVEGIRAGILHLAVQGRLSPCMADEEHADVFLARLLEERPQVVPADVRRPKTLPAVDLSQAPFTLPIGWTWARFSELGHFGRGKSKHRPRNAPQLYSNGSIPLVQTGDVARSNGVIETSTGMYNEVGLAQSRLWPAGTLCITIAANIADTGILGFDACFPDSVVGLIPSPSLADTRYFEYFMRTAQAHLEDFAPATAQKNINLSILNEVLIPLPPMVEMSRLVQQLDELMQFCDALEDALRERSKRAGDLLTSLTYHLAATTQAQSQAPLPKQPSLVEASL